MKLFLRLVAGVCVVIAAFLIYAVISAAASSGGAKVPVAVGYVVGAVVLGFGARWLWTRPGQPDGAAAQGNS